MREGVREGVCVCEGVTDGVKVEVGVKVFVDVGVNDNAAMSSCARSVLATDVEDASTSGVDVNV